MSVGIANVILTIAGLALAYRLMRDTGGAFAVQKADGMRLAIAFGLLFFGRWFGGAEFDGPFHWADSIGVGAFLSLAVVSLRYPPIV